MSYLLDTNVLSEMVRKEPDPRVQQWFEKTPDELLYISVLTLGEIRKGVALVADDTRRAKVQLWLEEDVPTWFAKRVLAIDSGVADEWGCLCANMGRPLPVIDSLLAATALHHQLRLVTRNTKDFNYPSLRLINPWES